MSVDIREKSKKIILKFLKDNGPSKVGPIHMESPNWYIAATKRHLQELVEEGLIEEVEGDSSSGKLWGWRLKENA